MPSSRYIRSLERRLRTFEDRQLGSPNMAQQADLHSSTLEDQPSSTRLAREARTSPLSPPRGHLYVPEGDRHNPPTIITESPEIFMGGKASESFTQLILNAMNRGSATTETHSFSSPAEIIGDAQDRSDLLEPPPDARMLIKMYIDFHHILTPIFHVPTILARFEQVLTCEPTHLHEHLYTVALMNMVCAIAAAHNRSGQARPERV